MPMSSRRQGFLIFMQNPFDRLIIAQARIEGLVAISSDGLWSEYGIPLQRP